MSSVHALKTAQIRAFPTLARVVAAGRAVRAGSRQLRAAVVGATALVRTRRVAPATTIGELLAIDGITVDRIGAIPARACLVITPADDPRLHLAILAGVDAAAVLPRAPGPRWLASALGIHVADGATSTVAATRHALAALQAGRPVVTSLAVAGIDELVRLASLAGAPIVAVAAAFDRHAPARAGVIVRAPMYAFPGEAPTALVARGLAELRSLAAPRPTSADPAWDERWVA
ncbi:MAG: hypothetical protein IPL61_20760 [Myxococcales bacterium]|nr:hypothetical protein [Myxococcales bacterium]